MPDNALVTKAAVNEFKISFLKSYIGLACVHAVGTAALTVALLELLN